MKEDDASRVARPTSVVWIELGEIALGIRTDQLLAIRSSGDEAPDVEAPIDLDERFESPIDEARPTRVLDLVGDVRFRTRAPVVVDDEAGERTHPLPSFLEAWGDAHGVSGLASRESGFGWIIDQASFVAYLRSSPGRPWRDPGAPEADGVAP